MQWGLGVDIGAGTIIVTLFTLCCLAVSKAELSIHFTVSFRLQCRDACSKAFTTERYVSCRSVYLPTSPITASSVTGRISSYRTHQSWQSGPVNTYRVAGLNTSNIQTPVSAHYSSNTAGPVSCQNTSVKRQDIWKRRTHSPPSSCLPARFSHCARLALSSRTAGAS